MKNKLVYYNSKYSKLFCYDQDLALIYLFDENGLTLEKCLSSKYMRNVFEKMLSKDEYIILYKFDDSIVYVYNFLKKKENKIVLDANIKIYDLCINDDYLYIISCGRNELYKICLRNGNEIEAEKKFSEKLVNVIDYQNNPLRIYKTEIFNNRIVSIVKKKQSDIIFCFNLQNKSSELMNNFNFDNIFNLSVYEDDIIFFAERNEERYLVEKNKNEVKSFKINSDITLPLEEVWNTQDAVLALGESYLIKYIKKSQEIKYLSKDRLEVKTERNLNNLLQFMYSVNDYADKNFVSNMFENGLYKKRGLERTKMIMLEKEELNLKLLINVI